MNGTTEIVDMCSTNELPGHLSMQKKISSCRLVKIIIICGFGDVSEFHLLPVRISFRQCKYFSHMRYSDYNVVISVWKILKNKFPENIQHVI